MVLIDTLVDLCTEKFERIRAYQRCFLQSKRLVGRPGTGNVSIPFKAFEIAVPGTTQSHSVISAVTGRVQQRFCANRPSIMYIGGAHYPALRRRCDNRTAVHGSLAECFATGGLFNLLGSCCTYSKQTLNSQQRMSPEMSATALYAA